MKHTLLLRLAGPMQSWGTQSRFSVRDTGLEPSKSGVIGLLCAALGRPRSAPVDDLAKLRMAVRVDREGLMKLDYHTAGGTHRKGDDYGVLTADGSSKRTVTSNRYYLADADFLVALESDDRACLDTLHRALQNPRWPLFFGRKAFVPGQPVHLQLADQSAEIIMAQYPWYARTRREKNRKLKEAEERGSFSLRAVFDAPFGTTPEVRCDVPLSFAQRRFTIRHVKTDWISLSPDLIKEESACTFRA